MNNDQLQGVLNADPKDANKGAISKWKELGRLSVNQILENSDPDFLDQIELSDLEFKTNVVEYGSHIKSGFFLKGTKKLRGIGRLEWKNKSILEGFFLNNSLNGFGRWIEFDGEYYIGEWKGGNYHGKGKRVYTDGRIEEGRWENGDFKGSN